MKSRLAALAASLVLLLVPCHPLAAQEDQTTFEGEIEVREVGLVVEPPEGRSLGALRPEEILVFEDGAPRSVIKTEPLRPGGGASPWSLVVYFDRVLASPETARSAALVLARQAGQLTDLGTVEVIVANPEPRVELAATRDSRGLSAILGEVSQQARQEGGRTGQASPPAAPDPAVLRRQLDRLVAFLDSRPGAGARALLLVTDSFLPSPGEAELLANLESGGAVPPGSAAAALHEASRVLAGQGWVTFAGPLRERPAERERRQMSDLERIRIQAGSGSRHGSGVPPVIPIPPPDAGPRGDPRVAGVFSQQNSAPLMALAAPTGGTVLGVEEQLGPALDGLARRWRIWYRAPESLDGRLRPVEVRLPSATGALRGPRWVRSATPEGLAASRARLLAGGGPVPRGSGHLLVDATLDGSALKLRLPPAGATAAGPLRITVSFDNAAEARHMVLPGVRLDKALEHTLEVQPPAGARRIGVIVEDLAQGRWGGTVVERPTMSEPGP